MRKNCDDCAAAKENNENKFTVKFRIDLDEIGDYSKDEIEEKLNNTNGIKDAIIKDKELIIDYDDIIVSPKKIKKILS